MPIPPDLEKAPVRILIVDDEPAITQLVAKAVKAAMPECEVVEAHDGFRAGTITATLKPNVVVLDLRMPGMDGYEVCRLIKSQEDTKSTQVIAMTAYPSPESEQRIMDCGARLCLDKPLEIQTLLKEIRAAL